ncbi:hypothetical protein A0H81_12859 [Grifola frondosa]|uniref:BTB domain-containing protein n=1 Tax=Grifola frondosa TaxID=5627 RepID=A0A1C7LSV2_GRIFR|nr:hypothetical protein A0H81_12859 [Grifola frondosa]
MYSASAKNSKKGSSKGRNGAYSQRHSSPSRSPSPVPSLVAPATSYMMQAPQPSSKQRLQASLKASLMSGTFIDAQFYVFSRRTTSGLVDTPQAVYASSRVLREAVLYFERLFAGNFSESILTRMDTGFPANQEPFAKYDYDSDSDLDDDEDDSIPPGIDKSARFQDSDERHERQDSSKGDESVCNLADKNAAESATPLEGSSSRKDTDNYVGCTLTEDKIPAVCGGMTGLVGRTVVIRDIAFDTFQAFIYYLYTGEVWFSPLRSQGIPTAQPSDETYQPPRCSPKSMYRLADKYDLSVLKRLAMEDIRSKLSGNNILVEVFSKFTSRYPEIQEMETEYFRSIRHNVINSIPSWMDRVAEGELPHSSAVLTLMMRKLAV